MSPSLATVFGRDGTGLHGDATGTGNKTDRTRSKAMRPVPMAAAKSQMMTGVRSDKSQGLLGHTAADSGGVRTGWSRAPQYQWHQMARESTLRPAFKYPASKEPGVAS